MSNYWSYKIFLTSVFIIASIIFYKFGFTSEGLVYFLCFAILLSVWSIINRKINYKKRLITLRKI
jgi:phosphatidylglycerophosphate synthase